MQIGLQNKKQTSKLKHNNAHNQEKGKYVRSVRL